ncbi:MAG: hypothetical protein ACXIVQ_14025 [Acidimicrobiales bacterium]
MAAITSWLRAFGTSGALVNARVETDRCALADRVVDEAVSRIRSRTLEPARRAA